MKSLVDEVNKALSSEQIEKILKRNHPAILCKLYHPHSWSWYRLNNNVFSDCVLKKLFDGNINAVNVYRTLEIVKGREKEIGYFSVSNLAKLLLRIKEHVEEIGLNDTEFEARFFNICSTAKDHTDTMPDYKRLLTEEIVNALPPLGNTVDIHFKQKNVVCKFHIPGEYAWYVFEGEFDPERGYRFFGMMEGDGMKLRHFYLTKLLKLIEMELPVQLDTSISNVPYHTV